MVVGPIRRYSERCILPSKRTPLIAALLLSLAPAIAHGQAMPAPQQGALPSATLRGTVQIDFTSAINGAAYRIQIAIPYGAPPPDGFPSIFVLDGGVLFGSFAGAVRNRSNAGEIEKAVVVGIESGEGPHGADRTRDFTAEDLTPYEKGIVKDLGQAPRFGGAALFRRVIEEEIKPAVAKLVALDPRREMLFGWSLGGLFTVDTMLRQPGSFSTYLALSPSLWRSGREVFGHVPAFVQQRSQNPFPRFFVGVGSLEGDPDSAPITGMTREDWRREMAYARMVTNVRDLADALKPGFDRQRGSMVVRIFEGDTHNSVPWSALNPVLDFALSKVR